jgi:hypothetical protein
LRKHLITQKKILLKKILFISIATLFLFSCENEKKPTFNIDVKADSLEIFAKNIISTPLYERDFAISKDRNEIMYSLGDFKQKKRFLVQIKKLNNSWSAPEVLNISGEHQDIEPFFSVDGKKLFFASNRPLEKDSKRNDYNIWFSEKKSGLWGEPKALDTIINTQKDEFYPSVSANGNLYFTAVRKDGIGTEDIFMAVYTDGKYQKPKVLSEHINSKTYEFNSYISPNEDLLIFSSFGRSDGFGGGDLYFSKKDKAGNWEKAKNMGKEINSEFLDYCPFLDTETNNLYFTSDRQKKLSEVNKVDALIEFSNSIENGMGNIYRINFDINSIDKGL